MMTALIRGATDNCRDMTVALVRGSKIMSSEDLSATTSVSR